jgi:CRISPR/Cas system CSM-associated protein Csm3 (group 7 of RAMP superfamily)
METISGNFIFNFLSEWHCSSGLTGTSEIDLTVIKGDDGFPYIPGRTVKGLLRDFARTVYEASGDEKWKKFIKNIFGEEGDMAGKVIFSNAVVPYGLKESINNIETEKNKPAVQYIYKRRTFTKIDENTGVAEDKTLRSIEFTIPLVLISEWRSNEEITTEEINLLELCAKGIKRLGLNRNRGFGRCKCTCVKK